MLISESYAEMVGQAYNRSQREGKRSYPAACFELSLLAHAQAQYRRKEIELLHQLGEQFHWLMPRRQRNGYTQKLMAGATLVLTDATKTILWTSQNFLAMTGYSPKEAIGKTPKILQGPDTDPTTLRRMRETLQQANSVKADLLNYRKGGEPYICRLQIDPIYDYDGNLTHFLAIEHEIT